ncbi:ribosome-associated protein [Mesoflavibacter sabulilitoris]|uniref:Aminoacyl-tRNA hydrolase n=1 Tax=Mesoflavibacter zeaxanthinifaciens subsp. sabulilitoris TaxID=1520893 RepID=A0A2T1N7D3_9FLAO|nr:alternative ribosome rescue aminoacyl-tRNA hydrolase ArfB [Mesoflavibacter zeaxanthinifaciens]MBB3124134.1 ribosome-associated protein [Mesoflavibacter zeaxanthinifaciens subsp. sabulilitoris]MCP4052677.1 aminoacyl-tRNA hydrolase [Mesoflavibacter sp.]PSG87703.1 aminoacyl-tRNA hydrolase [Mesoflavibacter zeaxanthinifaciens subsp. sabulilitoris]
MLPYQELEREFNFKAIRSSGSGGQHVNKVATKIELSFSVSESLVLNQHQKAIIIEKLYNRLTKDQVLILQCGETRSQLKNKRIAISRAFSILEAALEVKAERKPTKVPKSVIKKRLKNKKIQSEKKVNRRKPNID